MTDQHITPDIDAAINFLRSWHPEENWHICHMLPDGGALRCKTFAPAEADECAAFIEKRQAEGHNLYFNLNPWALRDKKARDADVPRVVGLGFDLDPTGSLDTEFQPNALGALADLEPTFIMSSGRGVWGFIRLTEPTVDLELARAVGVALQKRLNAQPGRCYKADNVADPSRIVRLPGSVNFPDARKREKNGATPTLARLLKGGTGMARNLKELAPAIRLPERCHEHIKIGEARSHSTDEALKSLLASLTCDQGKRDELYLAATDRDALDAITDDTLPDGSRSSVMFSFLCRAVWAGMQPEDMLGLIIDPAWPVLSDHVLSRRANTEHYGRRQVADAFNRQIEQGWRHPEPESAPESRERPRLVSLAPVDRDALPERPWLAEELLMRGMVSLVAARGGAGKSLFSLQLGIMCAMGMDWAYWSARYKTRVLVLNAEDDLDEQRRRLLSATEVMDTAQEELADRLLVLDVARFELLHRPPDSIDGAIQKTPLYNELVKLIRDEKIGLLIVDPLIETHAGLDENSNTDMKEVILGLRDLARLAGCCVMVVHHSRKGQVAGDQDSARGGSALVNACRVAVTLDPMSQEEARLLPPAEEDERWRYVKLCGAKANYTGRGAERWLRLESVRLRNNGSPEGDSSPGMVAVDLQGKGDLTDKQRMRVLNEVDMAANSTSWLRASKSGSDGRLDLRMMKILNIGKEVAGQFMKQLLNDGWVVEEEVTGQDRHKRKGLVVGRWPDETTQREKEPPF